MDLDFEAAWHIFGPAFLKPGETLPEIRTETLVEPQSAESGSNEKPKKVRKWRGDFVIGNVWVEIEGGVFKRGRHVRPLGFIEDCRKYNRVTEQGYRLLRFETTQMLYADPQACIQQVISVWRATR